MKHLTMKRGVSTEQSLVHCKEKIYPFFCQRCNTIRTPFYVLRTVFAACASSLAPLTSASAITRRHVRRLKHLVHGRQRAELRTRDANTPCVSIFTTIATLPGASAILASHLHHVRAAVLTRASATRARPIPSAERACRQPDRSTGYRAPIQPHRAVLAPPERRIIATNLRAGAPFLGTHATQRNTALDASDRTAGARTDARKTTLAIDRAAFSRATSRATLCRRRALASKDEPARRDSTLLGQLPL
jgi:hypothetical protein